MKQDYTSLSNYINEESENIIEANGKKLKM